MIENFFYYSQVILIAVLIFYGILLIPLYLNDNKYLDLSPFVILEIVGLLIFVRGVETIYIKEFHLRGGSIVYGKEAVIHGISGSALGLLILMVSSYYSIREFNKIRKLNENNLNKSLEE